MKPIGRDRRGCGNSVTWSCAGALHWSLQVFRVKVWLFNLLSIGRQPTGPVSRRNIPRRRVLLPDLCVCACAGLESVEVRCGARRPRFSYQPLRPPRRRARSSFYWLLAHACFLNFPFPLKTLDNLQNCAVIQPQLFRHLVGPNNSRV